MNTKSCSYIKNVLGVSEVIRPSFLDKKYQIQGSLKCDFLVFKEGFLQTEELFLLKKIMDSIQVHSWSIVLLQELSQSLIKSIITRSSCGKAVFFGSSFLSIMKLNLSDFHQIQESQIDITEKIQFAVTHSLEELNNKTLDSRRIRKMKLQSFEVLKNLVSKS